MNLVRLPSPPPPSLTVKALAKLMAAPASALGGEVRDHKYPRGGNGAHRVPYYQPATQATVRFLQSDGDVVALGETVALLGDRLAAIRQAPEASKQSEAKVEHNLRTLGDLPNFRRVRDALGARRGRSVTLEVDGFKIRSTPELTVQFRNGWKHVFLYQKETPLDEDEARRILELALWVESKGGGTATKMSEFEFWDLGAGLVHKWPRTRKRTVTKALKTLPTLRREWQAAQPPPRWQSLVADDAQSESP